jgi:hypothetical protein
MNQAGFNLITHPWIAVQTKAGFETCSLNALFSRAEEISDITEEAKNRHSLYLFLTALCHEAAYQALGRHPDKQDLPNKADRKTLMEWCLTYLKSPEAEKAFQDDTQFLNVAWPAFLKPTEATGTTPETIKGETHLSPTEAILTPEERFRNYLGLQAFYPWGPDSGSQRMDGTFHAILLGPNLAASLRLNLLWLTTKDLENSDTSQAQKAAAFTGRAAWTIDLNSPEGRENWIATKVGALTPLFRFITRKPTGWNYSACKPVWGLKEKTFAEKTEGSKTPRPFPDQLGNKKLPASTRWHWKYIIGNIDSLNLKLSIQESDRQLTVRVTGVPNTGTGVRNATLEKSYHFGAGPKETRSLQEAFPLCEALLKKVATTIKDKSKVKDSKSKRTPLKNQAILLTEEAIESSWNCLTDPEGCLQTWKEDLRQTLYKELNKLPASTKEEFESIEKTKKELQKILS